MVGFSLLAGLSLRRRCFRGPRTLALSPPPPSLHTLSLRAPTTPRQHTHPFHLTHTPPMAPRAATLFLAALLAVSGGLGVAAEVS